MDDQLVAVPARDQTDLAHAFNLYLPKIGRALYLVR
jgi:hypothetical protein